MEKLREILQQAGSLLEAEKSEDALKLLDSAPEELKKQSQFQYAKGSLHLHNQNVEAAIVAFENAIQLGPPIPEFFSNLGAALLYRAQDANEVAADIDLGRAIELLERALDLGPKLPHTYVNLASAYYQKNEVQKAKYYFELAHELFPEFTPAAEGLQNLEKDQTLLT